MTEAQQIAFMNEDGTIKSKEDFLKDVEEIYDEFKDAIEDNSKEPSTFETLVDPENQIDAESVLQTYDFMDRSVFITNELTMDHANSVFEILKFWNNVDEMDEVPEEERKPICIYINTPGGDLDAVFSIISSIKVSKTPVYTYTIGTAYSGGFFIGICGHKRFGFPYSSFMFHEGSAMDGGDAHKFIQRVEFYKAQLARLKKVVLENTKITPDEYSERKNNDWFMDPEEAIRYGVIDEIVDSFPE
jgi:ATP-dependent Clp protease protease subunit